MRTLYGAFPRHYRQRRCLISLSLAAFNPKFDFCFDSERMSSHSPIAMPTAVIMQRITNTKHTQIQPNNTALALRSVTCRGVVS